MEAMRKTDPWWTLMCCGWKGLRVVVVVDSIVCISRSLSIAFGWGQIMRGDNGNRCVRLCGSLARNAHSSRPLNSTICNPHSIYVCTMWSGQDLNRQLIILQVLSSSEVQVSTFILSFVSRMFIFYVISYLFFISAKY